MSQPNGWKAYYVATRAIVNINSEFFNIIKERSIKTMSHLWFNADYVKCVHASGELFIGYDIFLYFLFNEVDSIYFPAPKHI